MRRWKVDGSHEECVDTGVICNATSTCGVAYLGTHVAYSTLPKRSKQEREGGNHTPYGGTACVLAQGRYSPRFGHYWNATQEHQQLILEKRYRRRKSHFRLLEFAKLWALSIGERFLEMSPSPSPPTPRSRSTTPTIVKRRIHHIVYRRPGNPMPALERSCCRESRAINPPRCGVQMPRIHVSSTS